MMRLEDVRKRTTAFLNTLPPDYVPRRQCNRGDNYSTSHPYYFSISDFIFQLFSMLYIGTMYRFNRDEFDSIAFLSKHVSGVSGICFTPCSWATLTQIGRV